MVVNPCRPITRAGCASLVGGDGAGEGRREGDNNNNVNSDSSDRRDQEELFVVGGFAAGAAAERLAALAGPRGRIYAIVSHSRDI